MLQDHEFFLQCDPHMSKFEKLAEMKPTSPIPEAVTGTGGEALLQRHRHRSHGTRRAMGHKRGQHVRVH